jgi:uncharacterized membrane protein
MSVFNKNQNIAAKFAMSAAIFAVVGIVDAAYLTWHHLKHELVPCSVVSGCETVLTSSYAEIAGIPLAGFGLAAYILAFVLAISAFLWNRKLWFLFGMQVCLMTVFTVWLLYLQAYVIKAFCQFCLLSACVTLTLFIIAIISKFWRFR